MRRWIVAGMVVIASGALPSQLAAQGVVNEGECVMSARFLRLLGEAVDGHRTGARVWVVANCRADSVIAASHVRPEMEALARRLAQPLLGPFESPRHDIPDIVLGGCRHDGTTSKWDAICPQRVFGMADITGIQLLLRSRSGRVDTVSYPATTDAIFLSLAAIDKFVIPYYLSVAGAAEVASLRRAVVANAGRLRPR